MVRGVPAGVGSALAVVPEFGPFDALADIAHQFYVDGFSEQSVLACDQWLTLTRSAGDRITTRYLMYIKAVALQELGRHREAQSAIDDLLADLGERREPAWRAKSLSVLSNASISLNEHDRAMEALAEGLWLAPQAAEGSYGYLSAAMAIALALRAAHLFEPADEVFRSIRPEARPVVAVYVIQEAALTSGYWGATLALVGPREQADHQFVRMAGRAVHMQRVARAVGSTELEARAVVIESYAMMRLGEVELAETRALAAREQYLVREELLETHLLHLVLGHALAARGAYGEARAHLTSAAQEAATAGRDAWAGTAMEALADVDIAEHGLHPAVQIWKKVARTALMRVWSEREGRFAALRHRTRMRELTAETDRMGRAVLQDPLTGLGNRRLMGAALEGGSEQLSVVFVDVDEFKEVNDQFSHAVGDEVLRMMADIHRTHCRAQDVLIRYGGDEFIVLAVGDPVAADGVAQRLHDAVRSAPWDRVAPGLVVTVSIGVGHPGPGTDPLAAADVALGAAKRAGRDRIESGGRARRRSPDADPAPAPDGSAPGLVQMPDVP
jgi:diguanylate cyclase (GGDEF)-like protein